MNKVATIAAGVAFGLVAGAGVAVAVDPVEPEVINACAAGNNGSLRLLAAGETCNPKKETPVFWNVEGLPGPQGLQGDQGPRGEQGQQGDPGPEGPAGVGSPVKIIDGNRDEVPGSFFAGLPSIASEGFVWRVRADGTVDGVLPGERVEDAFGYAFFTDSSCTQPLAEPSSLVVLDGGEGVWSSNLTLNFSGKFFEQGALSTADLYWMPGLAPTCQPFTPPVWELGAELEKPADFVGPISVVAR